MASMTPIMIADMAAAAKNSRISASTHSGALPRANPVGSDTPVRWQLSGGEGLAGLIQVKPPRVFFCFAHAHLAAANES
jgi:hypothetical protein